MSAYAASTTSSTIPASAFIGTTAVGYDPTVYRLSREELDNLDVISKLITGIWPETVNARGVEEEKPRFDQIWESDGDGNDEMDEYLNGLEAGEAVEDRK